MALKYPNKRKRTGYWKRYERASIKDYLLVWNTILLLINEKEIPFCKAKSGRKPKLTKKECVAISVMYVYFDIDFRELEYLTALLTGKHLDHTNCVRWFGKLTLPYVDQLVFAVHQRILMEVSSQGDYIADASTLTCDRLVAREQLGEMVFEHVTWKMHLLVMYLWHVGLISVVSIFATPGNASESPILRQRLLQKERLIEGRKCHADKGFFGKKNIAKCKRVGLQANIVPKEQEYSDGYLKRYIRRDYDNEARKKNRGLIEGVFGGFETETDMKIRCRKPHHRDLAVALFGVKQNIRTYLRAIALMIFDYFAPTPVTYSRES